MGKEGGEGVGREAGSESREKEARGGEARVTVRPQQGHQRGGGGGRRAPPLPVEGGGASLGGRELSPVAWMLHVEAGSGLRAAVRATV